MYELVTDSSCRFVLVGRLEGLYRQLLDLPNSQTAALDGMLVGHKLNSFAAQLVEKMLAVNRAWTSPIPIVRLAAQQEAVDAVSRRRIGSGLFQYSLISYRRPSS